MKRWTLGVAAFCAILAAASTTLAQEESIEARLEKTAGVQPEAAGAFFDALRRNVGRNEHAATCALVAYPLAHATGTVQDAADCERRYDMLFTVAVRKAIGKQQFGDLFVTDGRVMVGIGELWFAATCARRPCQAAGDLHITAINSQPETLQAPKGKTLLACDVSGQRIRVVADGAGGASLRVWIAPRLDGPPAREFPRAEPMGAPTECGSRTWTFSEPARTYIVSELPCDAYLSPPPMGSVGRVTLSTPTSPGAALWCRE